jgi:hypothetical protein
MTCTGLSANQIEFDDVHSAAGSRVPVVLIRLMAENPSINKSNTYLAKVNSQELPQYTTGSNLLDTAQMM